MPLVILNLMQRENSLKLTVTSVLLKPLVVQHGALLRSTDTVTGLYGETIVVPCNGGAPPPDELMFIKWKYERDDGTSGDMLVKQAHKGEATVQATDDYAQRVSIASNSSLLISQGSLKDQRMFTCMVVSSINLREFPVTVKVYKKPSSPEIIDKATLLDKDKLAMLGTCVVKDANPEAEVTWTKNGQPIVADGKAVVVSPSVKVDPGTGLSTTSSTLQYTATKEDIGASFTCVSTHLLARQESAPETFAIHYYSSWHAPSLNLEEQVEWEAAVSINERKRERLARRNGSEFTWGIYPSEKVTLQVLPVGPITEGDNVTLKCHADGNPPPSSFNFHIKGQKTLVEDSDTYTLTAIRRDSAGEYKCSLVDNEKMEDSQSIAVRYLDLSLSPTGKVVKTQGNKLEVKMEKAASDDVKVTWTKDGKVTKAPAFGQLAYADAGVYVCEVTMGGLRRRQSFELVVEGEPVITRLTKHRADDGKHKVLTCEADGVPEPSFEWSVNGTEEESSYINGKATHKITVTPRTNLTVTCSVSNRLGEHFMTINVSSLFKEEPEIKGSVEDAEDQAKLIGGIVAGLLIAAAVMGLAYWLYMKNSRQGSWKTGEKEVGTSEESKKLEENNHV
ncbi:CD166 antigen homolog A [Diretmus argenteus]